MKEHIALLRRLDACSDAIIYAKGYDTLDSAWAACERPDWMLWLLERVGFNDPRLERLFACWCIRHTPLVDGRVVWDLLKDERSCNAVVISERYANGEATLKDLAAAGAAAGAAARDAARDAAGAAARDAAWVAAGAAQADRLREIVPFVVVAQLVDAYMEEKP